MRSIIFLFLLNCSTVAFAHELGGNPDTISGKLHVLLSPHHLQPLMLVAMIIAVVVFSRVVRSRHPR